MSIKPRRGKYKKFLNNERIKIMKPIICKNCGAPLHSKKCEYCDTEYL